MPVVWYWPNGTYEQWITASGTAPTSTIVTNTWWSNNVTSSATATTSTYTQIDQGLAHMQARSATLALAQAHYAQQAHERYIGLYRPTGSLGSLFMPAAPAIITRQDEARRDRELYRRAIAEHDEQEAARLLRLVERHEQLDADERRRAEHIRHLADVEQQRRQAAKDRARELLIEHLTPQQRETFDNNGWFIVEGGRSKTKYRIRAVESMVANVDVLGADRTLHRLCAHVRVGTVPLGDQLLAQKVMIELAEDDFLRVANRHAA